MNANPADFDDGAVTSEQQLSLLQKQLQDLYQNLRQVRHGINNDVAVIMAMAELSQRNPVQCQKLIQLCLEKAPQISSSIGGFAELYIGTLNLQKNDGNKAAQPL